MSELKYTQPEPIEEMKKVHALVREAVRRVGMERARILDDLCACVVALYGAEGLVREEHDKGDYDLHIMKKDGVEVARLPMRKPWAEGFRMDIP